jgi:hypothetical protein
MTSKGMRQIGSFGASSDKLVDISNEDHLSCDSKQSLLDPYKLNQYSNPRIPSPTVSSSTTNQRQHHLAETRFNGTQQLSPGAVMCVFSRHWKDHRLKIDLRSDQDHSFFK